MKTILITGATGLVGKKLTKRLIEKGYSIHYLTTRKEAIQKTKSKKGFYWNIKNNEIDTSCLENVTVIIHLAGASVAKRWTTAYKQEIYESRIGGTYLLLSLLENKNHSINHFISASGISIYPNSLTEKYSENCKIVNNSFLGKVVQNWEKTALQFQEKGIVTSILRTGIVLAEENSALQKMSQPIKLGFGAPLGSGKQIMSWVHIDDIVNAYLYILEHKIKGIFNVASPNPVNNKHLMQQVAKALNKKLWVPNIPSFMLKLLLGEMHEILLDSQNVSVDLLQKKGFQFSHKELTEALKVLI